MPYEIEYTGNANGQSHAQGVVHALVLFKLGRLTDGPTAGEYAAASSNAIARSLKLDPAEIKVVAEGDISRGEFGLSVIPTSPRAASTFSRFGCRIKPGA